ncbi:MAG: RNA-directed DNA polymerase [Terracidiphilus sp.]|nr:RNA-directed DNA polymerase [Terracidiphilus sp.]
MSKRGNTLTHPNLRSILTDALPFEVPPTFSNRGYYRFLIENNVEIEGNELRWTCDTDALDSVIFLLFGVNKDKHNNWNITAKNITQWGKTKTIRSVPLSQCELCTIPFNFRIAHGIEGRILSVVHPRNQIAVANFYAQYCATIIYYTSLSEFSIRRPVSVSRYAFFRDNLHEQPVDNSERGVEMDSQEYEELGSYFVYRRYRNIHRFFESFKYHRCEKKYNSMMLVDISKCFDSIYTHSLPWAVLGKPQTKFNLDKSKKTFSGRFDSLMQNLNHNETNGIVIGPEFSRIFAEIILQTVDNKTQAYLQKSEKLSHRKDYEIFRYVDDYFIFYNDDPAKDKILGALQRELKEMKLSVNPAKIKFYEKPIITEITIAKSRISELLDAEIDPKHAETQPVALSQCQAPPLSCVVRSNRLTISYKAIIKESKVTYGDLLNYTFHIVEKKLNVLLKAYLGCAKETQDQRRLIKAILGIMEFSFFAYSASPKVNHTIRICRMISTTTIFLNSKRIPGELKHLFSKYTHDNILQIIEKNQADIDHEIETLYLLVSLAQIGREYWLPESALARYFGITHDESSNQYKRDRFMNLFSITVFFTYVQNKKRYASLRDCVVKHVIERLRYLKEYWPHDAETLMLMLDFIVCPYVDQAAKIAAGSIFNLDASSLSAIQTVNCHWFTAWGSDFDLGKELDAKRSREVY